MLVTKALSSIYLLSSTATHVLSFSPLLPQTPNTKKHFPIINKQIRFMTNNEGDSSSMPMSVVSTRAADITETMRDDSLAQYSNVTNHFMSLDLRNDMVFLQNTQETSHYIDANFDAILFDCDGVLYRGVDQIPDAAKSLKSLLDANKKILFVTNNAGSNRMQLRDKLANILDCPELTESQMVSSSYSAVRYIDKDFEKQGLSMENSNVHVIGTEGLCDEFRKFRCANVSGGSSTDDKPSMSREELATYTFEHEIGPTGKVDAVCIGLDNEFNYRKLCIANVLLQRYPDALLVATNEDAYDLVGSDARHLPGNGSLVRALECCSERIAINVGKPSNILADLLREEHGLDPSRTVFVGDRLDTDVRFGIDGRMKSALVLTGCTTAEKLIGLGDGSDEEPLPHIIFPHMGMMGIDSNLI